MKYFNLIASLSLLVSITTATVTDSTQGLKIYLHSTYGGRSHIKHSLELSKHLIKRNHSVSYLALIENKSFLEGYDFVNYVELKPDPNVVVKGRTTYDFIKKNKGSDKKVGKEGGKPNLNQKLDLIQLISGAFFNLMPTNYRLTFLPMLQYLESNPPDLMICDYFSPGCIDVANKLNIPVITFLSTLTVFEHVTSNYLTKGFETAPTLMNDLNYFDKLYYGIVVPFKLKYQFQKAKTAINLVQKEYSIKPTDHFFGNYKHNIILANTFLGFELPLNIPTNIKLIGPLIAPEVAPITDATITNFLNTKTKVMIVAFGSMTKINTEDATKLLTGFITLLNNNDLDGVIFGLSEANQINFPTTLNIDGQKIDVKDTLYKLKNANKLMLMDWIPQRSLLNHDSVKVFLFHCGLESVFESLHAKKPLICIPYIGDQPKNAARIKELGVGYHLNRYTYSHLDLVEKVQTLLDTDNFNLKINLDKINLLLKSSLNNVHLAVNTVEEFVNLHKLCSKDSNYYSKHSIPCHLNHIMPIESRLSLVQRYNLDIWIPVGILVSVLGGLLFIVISRLVNTMFNGVNGKVKVN